MDDARHPRVSVPRRPVVGVMGSHSAAHADRAVPLGRWLAGEGYHLLTGAGGGVMETVSRAFAEVDHREGSIIGVVPTTADGARRIPVPGYPNPWVEIPIVSHLDVGGPLGDEPGSRNHVNVLTSTVMILLPGGEGTASEARLSLRYGTPCVAFLHSRAEIPSLSPDIPVESEIEKVKDFVRQATAQTTVPVPAPTSDTA